MAIAFIGFLVWVGIAAIRKGRQLALQIALALTLLLATGFLFIKYLE